MSFLKRYDLLIAVFLTGGSVLVIEVVAMRILSPHFGNTIFTVSSVLSVVLAALSVGYWFGGRFADRFPERRFFFVIIGASGASVVLLYAAVRTLLPLLGEALSLVTGPLVSAFLLFFLPAFLLGTLSPYAVKLEQLRRPAAGVGSVAGEVFFWSTLGSISGSLLAGFVLIPRFGIASIVLGVGAFLFCLGIIPLLVTGERTGARYLAFAFLIAAAATAAPRPLPERSTLFRTDGVYEQLAVYDDTYRGAAVRFFLQDRSVSGGMFLEPSNAVPRSDPGQPAASPVDDLVFDYTKYYALYPLFMPELRRALVIGGGAYSIPRALLSESPHVIVDVAEIEPSLPDIAKRYFGLRDDPRLANHIEDGRRFLRAATEPYDLIVSDVYYSLYSIPAHFTTREFFALARERLTGNGAFVGNFVGDLSRQEPSFLLSAMRTFRSVFPNSFFFAVDSASSRRPQNVIFVGWNRPERLGLSDARAAMAEHPSAFVRSSALHLIDPSRFELSSSLMLSDDFSPVDFLTGRFLSERLTGGRSPDGSEMMSVIGHVLRYGPRYLSSPGHGAMQEFLRAELSALADRTLVQSWSESLPDGRTYELENIIGRFFPERQKRIVLGTHYDSKKYADRDARRKRDPVPGANDSGSGVAVLLELAYALANRTFPASVGIDIVFFDGEEGDEEIAGDYANWEPYGSTYFARHLDELYPTERPRGGIIVDMVCDRDLVLRPELSSLAEAPDAVTRFWNIGRTIDPRVFVDRPTEAIADDHTPLNDAGIPSFLVIDREYPPYHTTADTLDRCSASSMETVARTIMEYVSRLP